MKPTKAIISKHVAIITGITAVLVLCIAYPFLPGGYDGLALPLSRMAQVFGMVGLPLVIIGLLWLALPKYKFVFAILSVIAATFVALVLTLFATFSVGNAFGILTISAWLYILFKLIPKLKCLKGTDNNNFNFTPLYLIALPLLTLIIQMMLMPSLTRQSRSRAILQANEFISGIEEYRSRHGRYPASLQAQNKDYYPGVVGVERYHYDSRGDGYNLSFEQPRFLLDRFGTREWVVYNPRGENRMFSHVAWLLPSAGVEPPQGWYASGTTEHRHWKYFLFD